MSSIGPVTSKGVAVVEHDTGQISKESIQRILADIARVQATEGKLKELLPKLVDGGTKIDAMTEARDLLASLGKIFTSGAPVKEKLADAVLATKIVEINRSLERAGLKTLSRFWTTSIATWIPRSRASSSSGKSNSACSRTATKRRAAWRSQLSGQRTADRARATSKAFFIPRASRTCLFMSGGKMARRRMSRATRATTQSNR